MKNNRILVWFVKRWFWFGLCGLLVFALCCAGVLIEGLK